MSARLTLIRSMLRGEDFERVVFLGLVSPEVPIGTRPYNDARFYFADEPDEGLVIRDFAGGTSTHTTCKKIIQMLVDEKVERDFEVWSTG